MGNHFIYNRVPNTGAHLLETFLNSVEISGLFKKKLERELYRQICETQIASSYYGRLWTIVPILFE